MRGENSAVSRFVCFGRSSGNDLRIHQQPSSTFEEAKLRELANNIKLYRVPQAILVRPTPDGKGGKYEVVARAWRFRASKLTGRATIPLT